MRYRIGDIIEVHGQDPWLDLEKDVEVVGYTRYSELTNHAINLYELWFVDKEVDYIHERIKNNNEYIYLVRDVTARDPYTIDPASELVYLFDDMFNIATTQLLVKRQKLEINTFLGKFPEDKFITDSDLKDEIKNDLVNLTMKYTSTGAFLTEKETLIVERWADAHTDDNATINYNYNIEQAIKQKEDEEQARVDALDERDRHQNQKESDLVTFQTSLDERDVNLDAREAGLNTLENNLIARELAIAAREEELGL